MDNNRRHKNDYFLEESPWSFLEIIYNIITKNLYELARNNRAELDSLKINFETNSENIIWREKPVSIELIDYKKIVESDIEQILSSLSNEIEQQKQEYKEFEKEIEKIAKDSKKIESKIIKIKEQNKKVEEYQMLKATKDILKEQEKSIKEDEKKVKTNERILLSVLPKVKILEKLNDEQRGPVLQTEGPVLVLAGAGSGKTRVLTSRIAYLVEEKRVPPSAILAITFTNKAAKEMQERLDRITDISSAWVCTIHSMCVRILRMYAKEAGIESNFSIYSEVERNNIVKKSFQECDYDDEKLLKDEMGKNFSCNVQVSTISGKVFRIEFTETPG